MEAIYARISDDREGTEHGVARQIEDAQGLAQAPVPEALIFVDNDISASTRSTKVRPGFDALVREIEAGKVTRVLAYSNSRLTRRPLELERLIQLHEKHGVVFRTVVSGQDDLKTADGRMVARIKASVDAAEAERVGERVARQKRQRAEDGKPQGGRYPTYGFTKDWQVVPAQADAVREAFKRRARGESVTSIGEVVGVPHGTLSRILKNPLYCGLRSYKGEVVGELHADFPRLVERVVWDAAQAVAVAPPAGTNSRKYLLSGIARCGKCGGKMKGAPSKGRAARYRCAASYGGCGTVSIRCDWIDEPVEITVVSREIAGKGAPVVEEVDDTEAETIRGEIRELQAAVSARTISMSTALPMLNGLEAALRDAEAAQKRSAAAVVAGGSWAIREAGDMFGAGLGERRALMAKHLAAVTIEEAPTRGRNALDLARVVLHYTDGTEERLSNEIPADGVSV